MNKTLTVLLTLITLISFAFPHPVEAAGTSVAPTQEVTNQIRLSTDVNLVSVSTSTLTSSKIGPALKKPLTETEKIQQAAEMLANAKFGKGHYSSVATIIARESGWNYKATNASSYAYGLGQALPASKMAPYGADYRTNPETQLKWMMDYIAERYGTPEKAVAFWNAHNYY